ncbi:MAG: hypothetical protein ACRDF8_08525 [Chloroflexota bacterium]
MPGWLGFLTLLGGLAVVLVAIAYPREVRRDPAPLIDFAHFDLPPIERLFQRRARPPSQQHAAEAPPPTAEPAPAASDSSALAP